MKHTRYFRVITGFGIDKGRFTVLLYTKNDNCPVDVMDGSYKTREAGERAALKAGYKAKA